VLTGNNKVTSDIGYSGYMNEFILDLGYRKIMLEWNKLFCRCTGFRQQSKRSTVFHPNKKVEKH